MTKAPESGSAAAGGPGTSSSAAGSTGTTGNLIDPNAINNQQGVEGAIGDPSNQPTPKDGQVIIAIMNELGIHDYEPAVVTQLLEFVYRYVTDLVDDAAKMSQYAAKNQIDGDDMRLAIQMAVDKSMSGPPPRDILAEIASHKNSIALPQIRSHNGPRLPADRYSLIAPNYRLRTGSGGVDGPQGSGGIVLGTRPSYFQSTLAPQPSAMGQRIQIPGQRIQMPQFSAGTSGQGVKRRTED